MNKLLSIDLGNSIIKIAGVENGEIKTNQIKSLVSNYGFNSENTVLYNGHKYHFGTGNPLIVKDKTKRKLLDETILLSYYKTYGESKNDNVNLAIGLPLNIYLSDHKLRAFENKIEYLKCGELTGIVDDKEVNISINDIKICAEGYSTFDIVEKYLDKNTNNILSDVGYKTTDVISLSYIDETWVITENFTIEKGMWDIFYQMQQELYNDYGIDISPENIEQRLLSSCTSITANKVTIDLYEMIVKTRNVVDYIFEQMSLKIQELNTSDIYLLGGGSIFVNDILAGEYSNVILLDNFETLLYANALGFLQQIS